MHTRGVVEPLEEWRKMMKRDSERRSRERHRDPSPWTSHLCMVGEAGGGGVETEKPSNLEPGDKGGLEVLKPRGGSIPRKLRRREALGKKVFENETGTAPRT